MQEKFAISLASAMGIVQKQSSLKWIKRHRFDLVCGRQRMMLVNDKPSSIMLTESHGEAELEVGLCAIALGVDAMPDGRCEGHIVSGCDFYILKVERNRLC